MHFKRTTDYKNTHIEKFTSFFSYRLSFMRMFLSAIMANLIKVQILLNILGYINNTFLKDPTVINAMVPKITHTTDKKH